MEETTVNKIIFTKYLCHKCNSDKTLNVPERHGCPHIPVLSKTTNKQNKKNMKMRKMLITLIAWFHHSSTNSF